MRRALMTAILACSGSRQGKPINLVLMPNLRERVSYKNTVAGSVSELEALVTEVMAEA